MQILYKSIVLYGIVNLYSVQYLHVLQDLKRYIKYKDITHLTVEVHYWQITDILLTEGQRLKDDHLSTSLRFFKV